MQSPTHLTEPHSNIDLPANLVRLIVFEPMEYKILREIGGEF